MLGKPLENLHNIMLGMHCAAVNENWDELENLDIQRAAILDALPKPLVFANTEEYLSIRDDIIKLDQEILSLTDQRLQYVASKVSQDNDYSKVRAHYQRYLD